jgi:hypothetical protein
VPFRFCGRMATNNRQYCGWESAAPGDRCSGDKLRVASFKETMVNGHRSQQVC